MSEKSGNEQNEISRKGRYIERTIYMREYAADLRCNRSKEYIVKKFDDKVADNISLVRRFKKITLGFRLYNLSAPHIIDFVAMGMAAYKITIGTLSVGDFTGTIQASKQLYWCMSPLINMANEINMYALYSQNLQKFFNTESVIESPKIRTGRELTPKTADMPFAVEMKNVSFSYDNSNFALKNISMSIKPGQKIAIVGENGAGKSTLTKLLLRLYDTSSGDILINGQPIQDYDVHALRSDIGIAFQNTNLFAMTLAENMKVYREVSDEKLNESSESSGCHPSSKNSTADLTHRSQRNLTKTESFSPVAKHKSSVSRVCLLDSSVCSSSTNLPLRLTPSRNTS